MFGPLEEATKLHLSQNPRILTPEGFLPWRPTAPMFQAVPSCWFVAIASASEWWSTACDIANLLISLTTRPQLHRLGVGGGGAGDRTSFQTHKCTNNPDMSVSACTWLQSVLPLQQCISDCSIEIYQCVLVQLYANHPSTMCHWWQKHVACKANNLGNVLC